MDETTQDRITKSRVLIGKLNKKLKNEDSVIAFIVYGSYSDNSDHSPTQYSDIDLEIVVTDKSSKTFVNEFRSWFEKELEPILIDTSVSHLQKIFVTNDFINLEFHISIASDFDHIDKRDLNYFPNGYSILFDKSGLLNNKIVNSIQPSQDISQQEKFDKLNNSFWFFVQSTAPFIERGEYWFAAAGYWVWMYVKLCTLLRMYSNTEVSYNPMKHIEEILNPEIITEIQPLRNLENPSDLKNKMRLLINIYSKYAKKTANLNSLTYTSKQENKVKEYVNKYLAN